MPTAFSQNAPRFWRLAPALAFDTPTLGGDGGEHFRACDRAARFGQQAMRALPQRTAPAWRRLLGRKWQGNTARAGDVDDAL
jgi:hypothetical protein